MQFISEIAWPVTVLILAFMFKGGISATINDLLSKTSLRELSAGSSGVKAIFEAQEQATEGDEAGDTRERAVLPAGQGYTDLRARQDANETPHSKKLYESVKQHIGVLDADPQEKLDLLCIEVAQLQALVQFLEAAKVLFRSQFELLSDLRDTTGSLSVSAAKDFFRHVASKNPDIFRNWDFVAYLAYPTSKQLLEYKDGRYYITEFGISFTDAMRRNPQLITELSNL